MKLSKKFYNTTIYTSIEQIIITPNSLGFKQFDIIVPLYIIFKEENKTYRVLKFNFADDYVKQNGIDNINCIYNCYSTVYKGCKTLKDAKCIIKEIRDGIWEVN